MSLALPSLRCQHTLRGHTSSVQAAVANRRSGQYLAADAGAIRLCTLQKVLLARVTEAGAPRVNFAFCCEQLELWIVVHDGNGDYADGRSCNGAVRVVDSQVQQLAICYPFSGTCIQHAAYNANTCSITLIDTEGTCAAVELERNTKGSVQLHSYEISFEAAVLEHPVRISPIRALCIHGCSGTILAVHDEGLTIWQQSVPDPSQPTQLRCYTQHWKHKVTCAQSTAGLLAVGFRSGLIQVHNEHEAVLYLCDICAMALALCSVAATHSWASCLLWCAVSTALAGARFNTSTSSSSNTTIIRAGAAAVLAAISQQHQQHHSSASVSTSISSTSACKQ